MVKISILDLQTSVHSRIGENIRRAREARGMSQEEVARACRISQAQLSRIEKGKRLPSLKVFIKLTGALNVSAEELANLEGYDGMHSDRDDGDNVGNGGDNVVSGARVPDRVDLGGWER